MPTPDEIIALAADGLSAAEVASRLGCAPKTIYRTLEGAGITSDSEAWPWGPRGGAREGAGRPRTLTLAQVKGLAKQGLSQRAAALELGCTPRTIRLILERNGVTWATLGGG